MERIKTRILMIITVLMVLMPKIMSVPLISSHPLCITQFALVNHACAVLSIHHHYIPHPPAIRDGHGQEQQKEQEDQVQLEPEHESLQGHRHRHHHHHHHQHLGEEVECCRWLKEVDTVCVCEVLFHLPLFLRVPRHSYRVSVGDECRITFRCGDWS